MRGIKNARHLQMSERTTLNRCFLMTALLAFLVPAARAQEEEQKGIDQGNYNTKQSIEFGGRFTNLSGDFQAYNSFVNLQQGPRLLGFTMERFSTASTSPILATAATPTTCRGCARVRTSGTTSTRNSEKTKTSGITL